jgi:hypothetical protein
VGRRRRHDAADEEDEAADEETPLAAGPGDDGRGAERTEEGTDVEERDDVRVVVGDDLGARVGVAKVLLEDLERDDAAADTGVVCGAGRSRREVSGAQSRGRA